MGMQLRCDALYCLNLATAYVSLQTGQKAYYCEHHVAGLRRFGAKDVLQIIYLDRPEEIDQRPDSIDARLDWDISPEERGH